FKCFLQSKHLIPEAFNCTIEELKCVRAEALRLSMRPFNCTIEELKSYYRVTIVYFDAAFNCTIEELKLMRMINVERKDEIIKKWKEFFGQP
ncbi:MAG: hypothetical protein M3342_06035, partial [Bacteroidota bacterium]|nr:hypothetical protein [Bacteroidota bacterium]